MPQSNEFDKLVLLCVYLLATPLSADTAIELSPWDGTTLHANHGGRVDSEKLQGELSRSSGLAIVEQPLGVRRRGLQSRDLAGEDDPEEETITQDQFALRSTDVEYKRRKNDADATEWEQGMDANLPLLSRTERAKLSLMPLQFGKRRLGATDLTGGGDGSDVLIRVTRGRLQRMPLTFGKRAVETSDSSADFPSSLPLIKARNGQINRMPTFFGKRDNKWYQDGTTAAAGRRYEWEEAKQLGATGERPDGHADDTTSHSGDFLDMMKMSSPGGNRVSLNFGKGHIWGNSNDEQDHSEGNRDYLSSVLPSSDISRVETPGDRYHQYEYLSRLFMNGNGYDTSSRTEHDARQEDSVSFLTRVRRSGKKQHHKLRTGSSKSRQIKIMYRMKDPVTSEMVYIDLPGLVKEFQRHASEFPHRHGKRMKARAQELLNKYFTPDALLSRNARSRLGRMPLTFGKRLQKSYLPNTSSAAEDMTSSAFAARGSPVARRSRMDRMPLSFGKRSVRGAPNLQHNQSFQENMTTRVVMKPTPRKFALNSDPLAQHMEDDGEKL